MIFRQMFDDASSTYSYLIASRRGAEEVSLVWLAEQLRTFVDLNPEFEVPVDRLATWLARLDDDED